VASVVQSVAVVGGQQVVRVVQHDPPHRPQGRGRDVVAVLSGLLRSPNGASGTVGRRVCSRATRVVLHLGLHWGRRAASFARSGRRMAPAGFAQFHRRPHDAVQGVLYRSDVARLAAEDQLRRDEEVVADRARGLTVRTIASRHNFPNGSAGRASPRAGNGRSSNPSSILSARRLKRWSRSTTGSRRSRFWSTPPRRKASSSERSRRRLLAMRQRTELSDSPHSPSFSVQGQVPTLRIQE
jgi:hypothetical protein